MTMGTDRADQGKAGRPLGLLIVAAVLTFSTIYAALRTHGLMDHFRELLAAFGSDLSPLTSFVLDAPNFWWIVAIPAGGVFLWIAARSRVTATERARMKAALIGALLFAVLVYGLVAYALYSPLFKLGAAI
jgi:hypothetical protein